MPPAVLAEPSGEIARRCAGWRRVEEIQFKWNEIGRNEINACKRRPGSISRKFSRALGVNVLPVELNKPGLKKSKSNKSMHWPRIVAVLWLSCVAINWLALVVVVADLVQEQFLDGVELLGPLEEDSGDADVPAQRQAHGGAQHGGQLEEPVKCHLRERQRKASCYGQDIRCFTSVGDA